MVRPLLMARVGIHHRLLFRCDDGMLDVMDLITRETLLTTLKRIRALDSRGRREVREDDAGNRHQDHDR